MIDVYVIAAYWRLNVIQFTDISMDFFLAVILSFVCIGLVVPSLFFFSYFISLVGLTHFPK